VGKSIQVKLCALVHLLIIGTAFAYAADANDFVAGIESIPLDAFKYVAMVAFAAGTGATLIKVARPDVVVKRLPIEIAKDLFCSGLAGMLVFFFTSWVGLTIWPQLILILLAGFGGTQVLDVALAKGFFPWLSTVLGRLSGPVPPSDSSKP
jgi:hypothetical protein